MCVEEGEMDGDVVASGLSWSAAVLQATRQLAADGGGELYLHAEDCGSPTLDASCACDPVLVLVGPSRNPSRVSRNGMKH